MGVIVLILLLSVNVIRAKNELPCHFLDSINITDGIKRPDQSIFFDNTVYPRNQYSTVEYILEDGTENVAVAPHIRGCICNIKPCLRLCCPLGSIRSYQNETIMCRNQDTARNFKAEVLHENNETKVLHLDQYFGYVEGHPCKFVYSIAENHTLTHKGNAVFDGLSYTHHNSCLSANLNKKTNEVELELFMCLEESNFDFDTSSVNYVTLIFTSCMLVSVVSLIFTAILYNLVPKLQTTQGYCLYCYIISQIIGDLIIIFMHRYHYIESHLCVPLVYFTILSLNSAFFWLNILNFHFWINFCSKSQFKQFPDKKKLRFYSMYGVGIPCLLTLLFYILERVEFLPLPLRDESNEYCSVNRLYFYFEFINAIMFIINIVFFILIAMKFRQIQKTDARSDEDNPLTKLLEKKKENFMLYFRPNFLLSISCFVTVFGISINFSPIFAIPFLFTLFHGVVFFIAFVLNRRIIRLIKERWQNWRKRTPAEDSDVSKLLSVPELCVEMSQIAEVE